MNIPNERFINELTKIILKKVKYLNDPINNKEEVTKIYREAIFEANILNKYYVLSTKETEKLVKLLYEGECYIARALSRNEQIDVEEARKKNIIKYSCQVMGIDLGKDWE